MNGTVIDIPGIHVNVGLCHLEHSPDQAHSICIKDESGNQVIIIICFGKIAGVTQIKK